MRPCVRARVHMCVRPGNALMLASLFIKCPAMPMSRPEAWPPSHAALRCATLRGACACARAYMHKHDDKQAASEYRCQICSARHPTSSHGRSRSSQMWRHAHTHAHTLTRLHTRRRTRAHERMHPPTHPRMPARALTRACPLTPMPRVRTHTHTHTQDEDEMFEAETEREEMLSYVDDLDRTVCALYTCVRARMHTRMQMMVAREKAVAKHEAWQSVRRQVAVQAPRTHIILRSHMQVHTCTCMHACTSTCTRACRLGGGCRRCG